MIRMEGRGIMTDTLQERIEKLTKQQEQLKARKRQLLARAGQQERKARTRRLIQLGAVMEKALGIELDERGRELLLEQLTRTHHGEQGDYTRASRIIEELKADGYEPDTEQAENGN